MLMQHLKQYKRPVKCIHILKLFFTQRQREKLVLEGNMFLKETKGAFKYILRKEVGGFGNILLLFID